MHRLGDDSCLIIASYSSDRRNYALVNKAWNRAFSSSDQVWLGSLLGDYGTSDRLSVLNSEGLPSPSACVTYRQAWQSWRSFECQFEQEGEPRFKYPDIWRRAIIMWDNMDRALFSMFGRRDLLNAGCKQPCKMITSKPIRRKLFDEEPRLYEAVRAIWGIHDGADQIESFFGSISWYDDHRIMSMLELQFALGLGVYPFPFAMKTQSDRAHGPDIFRYSSILGYSNGRICRRYLAASESTFDDDPTDDALLDFFERYALELLNNGRYSQRGLDGNSVLLGFPLRGPQTSEAITQGLRVRASYCPVLNDRGPNLLYVYQITIDYYPPAEQARLWQGKRAVLIRRHWEFGPERSDVVDDMGVIGLYPCFDEQGNHRPDFESGFTEGPFSYCSCVHSQPGMTMEGYFTFAVEESNGDIAMNQSFRVNVGKLTFRHPTFPL